MDFAEDLGYSQIGKTTTENTYKVKKTSATVDGGGFRSSPPSHFCTGFLDLFHVISVSFFPRHFGSRVELVPRLLAFGEFPGLSSNVHQLSTYRGFDNTVEFVSPRSQCVSEVITGVPFERQEMLLPPFKSLIEI